MCDDIFSHCDTHQGVGQTNGHRTSANTALCNVDDLMNDGDSCYKTQLTMTTVDMNGLRVTDCEVVV